MIITHYSKQEAMQLGREWRQAAATAPLRRVPFREVYVAEWRARAANGLRFLHENDSIAGTVEFEAGDVIPPPGELSHDLLGLDSAWFFGSGYEWALYGNHEDWDVLECHSG